MPMPSVGKAVACFALHPLEQPIHRRTMHGDGAANSRLARRCSLLNVSDDLTLGSLALLWGHSGWHSRRFSFFLALMRFFSVYHHLPLLSRCVELLFTVRPCSAPKSMQSSPHPAANLASFL